MGVTVDLSEVLKMLAKQLACSLSEITKKIELSPEKAREIMQTLEERGLVRSKAVPGTDDAVYTLTGDGLDAVEGTIKKKVSSAFDRLL